MMPLAWLRRMTGSVRVRVTLLAAGTFALALTLASVALLRLVESRLVANIRAADESALQDQAVRVLVSGVPPPGAGAFSLPLTGNAVAVQILGPDGSPIVATSGDLDHLAAAGVVGDNTVQGSAGGGAGTFVESIAAGSSSGGAEVQVPIDAESAQLLGVNPANGPYLVTSLRVNDGLSLATASSLAEVHDTLATTRGLLWFAVPGLVLLVAGLAWIIVGRALRPVHAVTAQVASIGGHSLHERVPVPIVADEVGELAQTMNSMLDRLEGATLANRRLVSDASHELRTPIAVMRAELEVARREPSPDWREVSEHVLAEVDRLQALVDDLLLLARLNERATAHEAFSLTDVVHDVGGRRRRVPINVSVSAGADGTIDGDETALRRALDHVVANAARHAGTRVDVTVERTLDDGALAVHVDDDGPGIPEHDRQRVLERFVRLDHGRSRDAGGSGLGLSIAADVMSAHDGELQISSSPLGGARVTFAVPSRPAAPLPA